MESLHVTGDIYRLIVTRRNASEILLLQNGSGWALPRVEIQQQQRSQNCWRQRLAGVGLEAYCLFVQRLGHPVEMGKQSAQSWSLSVTTTRPCRTYWMQLP